MFFTRLNTATGSQSYTVKVSYSLTTYKLLPSFGYQLITVFGLQDFSE